MSTILYFRPSLLQRLTSSRTLPLSVFTLILSISIVSCATGDSNRIKGVTGSSAGTRTDADKPAFTSPDIRRIWIPDKIDGNKYVKGHYEYIIERGSVWTMP